jgi:hypothetical protein
MMTTKHFDAGGRLDPPITAYDKRLIIKAVREKAARYTNPNWRWFAEDLVERIQAGKLVLVRKDEP